MKAVLTPARVVAGSMVLAVALCGISAFGATTGPSKGDAAAGKKIFAVKCIACHKPDGTGGVKLTGNPTPNWKDPKVWADPKRKSDDFFRDCITNGKPTSGMVAWGKTGQIKPVEIENLIAYIHTFRPVKK